MRYYGFSNYYISQIQVGIQNLHCVVEMRNFYPQHAQDRPPGITKYACDLYTDWADNHKTVILLNGGNQQSLLDILAIFSDPANPYPFGYFREDQQSLNNCLTCVGIILPEKIYEGASILRDRRNRISMLDHNNMYILVNVDGCPIQLEPIEYTTFETRLMYMLNDYRLA